jgi:hypothetical protein
MAVQQPLFQENDTTDQHAIQLRTWIRDMYNNFPGVLKPSDLRTTQRGAGANMSVDVSSGAALVPGTVVTHQGFYYVFNDGTVNLTIAPSDPSNPRHDLIVARVRDSFYSGADNDAELIVVTGTPAGSPADPDLAALGYTNYQALARVFVGTGVTSITTANCTNFTNYAQTRGTVFVCTSATRPSGLTALDDGFTIYETDTDRLLIFAGVSGEWLPPKNVAWGQAAAAWRFNTTAPHVTASVGSGATAVTDFALNALVARGDRAYEVHFHSAVSMSATTASGCLHELLDNGVLAARLHHDPDGWTAASQKEVTASCLWLPASGTRTLTVRVQNLAGAGEVFTYTAAAGRPRSFWATDIGPR